MYMHIQKNLHIKISIQINIYKTYIYIYKDMYVDICLYSIYIHKAHVYS